MRQETLSPSSCYTVCPYATERRTRQRLFLQQAERRSRLSRKWFSTSICRRINASARRAKRRVGISRRRRVTGDAANHLRPLSLTVGRTVIDRPLTFRHRPSLLRDFTCSGTYRCTSLSNGREGRLFSELCNGEEARLNAKSFCFHFNAN